jgi:ubiquinone/menaquinone biosynthesis C-methylase UbiE
MDPRADTKIATQYNEFAAEYSTVVEDNNKESNADYFSNFPKDMKGKTLLDLGCGSGYDLKEFKVRGAFVYGMDASEEMVNIARKTTGGRTIRVGTFDKIPYDPHMFDFVVSKWAFQTAAQMDPIYEQVFKVLRPGGSFIFLTGHPIRQFMEKKQDGKDYFKKETVVSTFFDGKITAKEPSHTQEEYLSPSFFSRFNLFAFKEGVDSGAEKINGDTYPSYLILGATRK